MMELGSTTKYAREAKGYTQRRAAKVLSISDVHLCNLEHDKVRPSAELLERMRELWGVDIYALTWCLRGDLTGIPEGLHRAVRNIGRAYLASVHED